MKIGKPMGNPANVKRFAKRCGLEKEIGFTAKELYRGYKDCKEQTKRYMAESPWMRKQFLTDKLLAAIDSDRTEEAKRVKDMLRNEAQKKEWAGIKRSMGNGGSGAVTEVDKPLEDGSSEQCTTKETVEEAIGLEIKQRFNRADIAPICQGALFDLLGYGANTVTAVKILEGTFVPPIDTDGPTVTLLEEIAKIWKEMGKGEVDIVVTEEDFQHYWRRVKERTSSSYSGLHFGHYKAAAHSDYLSRIHALKVSLITESGESPER